MRLVQRLREEAERVGFWWACGFMMGYVTALFERRDRWDDKT